MTNVAKEILKHMFCIYYFVQFHNNKIQTLFNSRSKVNTINLNYIQKLGLIIQKTNIRAQKLIALF